MNDLCRNYTLYRLTLVNANQEYSQVLKTRPSLIRVHCEDLVSSLRISFNSGGSVAGEVIFPGAEWGTPYALVMPDKTIYMQSPNSNVIVDIMEYEL